MRALELVAVDGPHAPGLTDAPETHADPDGIVVDVRAIGVHHPDLLLTKGAANSSRASRSSPAVSSPGVVCEATEDSEGTPGYRVAATSGPAATPSASTSR